jgi:hypothetical protein
MPVPVVIDQDRLNTIENRGVWESGWWLGPTVSLTHTAADIDRYVELFGRCLADLVASDAARA